MRGGSALLGMGTTRTLAMGGGDDDLEAAFAAHDKRRVLTLLMTRHGDGIYRYAMAMTRDSHLADEIRQQVFVDAYRDLDKVTGADALPAWTFGIARNRCLDAVRARVQWAERYKNEPPEHAEPVDHDLDHDLGHDLDRGRLARILADCLAKLAPAVRDAVVLRYQQELSYDEAAAIAGDLPGTLQRRVARALPVLRRCVQAALRRNSCHELRSC